MARGIASRPPSVRYSRSLATWRLVQSSSRITEVTEAIKLNSPREVVQLIHYVTGRAFFNRVTEAAGLPAES